MLSFLITSAIVETDVKRLLLPRHQVDRSPVSETRVCRDAAVDGLRQGEAMTRHAPGAVADRAS